MAETNSPNIYVVDTSSWLSIDGHPAQNRILSSLAALVLCGQIRIPPEVFEELQSVSDVVQWVAQYKDLILERNTANPDYLQLAGTIAHRFPAMAGATGRKNKADPWVIATAIHGSANGQSRTVVCNESSIKRPGRKMPTACSAFGLECLNLIEVLNREFPNDNWIE